MANTLTINDISAVANKILANAQGRPNEAVSTADFTTIAQTALLTGYDPLMTAVSQILSTTIFSYRPYNAKFRGLEKDAIRWGNHVRKLNPIDKPLEVDNRLRKDNGTVLVDGDTVDQYRINKPEVLQTNFYGSQSYQKSMTVWTSQLDTALQNAEAFGNFISMVMGNATDQLAQAREDLARGAVVNLIGGTYTLGQVWHVLTDYNQETGGTFTATTIMEPGNFADFYRWFIGKLQSISDRMEERTILNHVNPFVGGEQKLIRRHTPKDRQHLYMFADFVNNAETVANSVTFHDDYLKRIDFEKVTFWQNASTPKAINTSVSYLTAGSASADSALDTAAFENNTVIGILFDDEACGINLVNQQSAASPLNARGMFSNFYWHETCRWFNDNSENALVICLD